MVGQRDQCAFFPLPTDYLPMTVAQPLGILESIGASQYQTAVVALRGETV